MLPNEAGRANRAATWIPKSGSQSQSRQIEMDRFLCGALTFIATDRETAPAGSAAGAPVLAGAIRAFWRKKGASFWKKKQFNHADFI